MLIVSQRKYNSLRCSNIRFDPEIGDKEIEIRNETKYLGSQIDDALNWKEHNKAVCAEISRAVVFLKYSKRYIPISAIRTLYNSILQPHFLYCYSIWGCCSAKEIQHLQRLLKRVTRIVTNRYHQLQSVYFERLVWKTIQQLISKQTKIVTLIF